LIERLPRQSRQDHGSLAEMVMDLLSSEEARPILRRTARLADRRMSRLAYRLLINRPRDDILPVLAEMLKSRDPIIRLRAAREVRTRLSGDALLDVLVFLSRDRFMPVRREAIYGYVERLPNSAEQYLRGALLDPHLSMREAARFFLNKAGFADFLGVYESAIEFTDEKVRAAAVSGLGEVGAKVDAQRIAPLLHDASTRVRRAAVRATARLDIEGSVDALVEALEDPGSAVAKAARDALIRRPGLLDSHRLWAMFERPKLPQTRRILVSMFAKLPWWDSAALLVSATSCGDDFAKTRAIAHLHRWRGNIARMTAKPTGRQLELLSAAIRANREQLPKAVIVDLDAHVAFAMRDRLR
jgi:HEAT repeat protein